MGHREWHARPYPRPALTSHNITLNKCRCGLKVGSPCPAVLFAEILTSCRIATSPRREGHNIAGSFSGATAKHLYVEVADFLPQSVAVKPQQIGRADLISPGRGQSRCEQRVFHLAQNAVIEAGRRQAVFEPREIGCEVTLDRAAEIVVATRLFASNRKCGLRQ